MNDGRKLTKCDEWWINVESMMDERWMGGESITDK
jgi:hypothetical protein